MSSNEKISGFEAALSFVKSFFRADRNTDIIIRELRSKDGRRAFLAYIDGMASSDMVNDYIMRPLMRADCSGTESPADVLEYGDCTLTDSLDTVCNRVLQGDTAVILDGCRQAAICETKGFDKRSVSTPETENVVKGSHEAFNESIRSNITLVRRALKTGALLTEMVSVGNLSGEKCAVLYLDGVTDPETVERAKFRLKNVRGDFYSGSAMISQMIEDSRFSLFPSVLTTERPERTAQYLAAGRLAIICDNTPFAIIVPITVSELFDSPEGNQQRWQNGTFAKIVRVFAFVCATVLSGLYIGVLNFHRELLPVQLLSIIAASRVEIPFTAMSELIIMELFFELVREAGIRIPNAVGSAVGVVSGLILGQAAVEAKIVSPVTLIIVAITGIANAALPDYDMSFGIRIVKFALILLGGAFGLVGLALGVTAMLVLLGSQRSFGVAMSTAPKVRSASTGLIVQTPLWLQELREKYLRPERLRQQPDRSRAWEEDGK